MVGYYAQSVRGHLEVVGRTRPLPEVINDDATSPELKETLQRAQAIRRFASRELGLPDTATYQRYADMERPSVPWTVVATEAERPEKPQC